MWVKVQVPENFEGTEIAGYSVFTPAYHEVLNHGFIGLVDFMGSDQAVDDAARVSYGKGTRKVSALRGLIRYLKRHVHTSPFEMVQLKWHVKLPIFVARQWIRHRTGAFNEYSARYSKLDQEFYLPTHADAKPQAVNNKQGRSQDELTENDYEAVIAAMEHAFAEAFTTYMYLLGPEKVKLADGAEGMTYPSPPNAIQNRALVWKEAALNALMKMKKDAYERGEPIEIDDSMIDAKIQEYYKANALAITSEDYPGLARELARCVVPVSVYTQWYWTVNLHNLMHFMKLRSDDHAQKEIRVYSDIMREILSEMFPVCMEAFEEYQMGAVQFSKTEIELMREFVAESDGKFQEFMLPKLKERGMTDREVTEFAKTFHVK